MDRRELLKALIAAPAAAALKALPPPAPSPRVRVVDYWDHSLVDDAPRYYFLNADLLPAEWKSSAPTFNFAPVYPWSDVELLPDGPQGLEDR